MKKLDLKTIVIFIVLVSVALTAVVLMLSQGLQSFLVSEKLAIHKEIKRDLGDPRILDGVYMEKNGKEKYPVAVMIDNKLEARPWVGLSHAGLVFEAPVEGGITRFLAIFTDGGEVAEIGAVRSARPYFIDWAMGMGAIYVHVGGSPEALGIIADNPEIKKLDLNEYFNANSFWRSDDRLRPHNLLTSSKLLDEMRESKDLLRAPQFDSWEFKDDANLEERGESSDLEIKFRSYNGRYNAIWKYDREDNFYKRMTGDEYAVDSKDRIISAKNIVVLETDIVIIDSVSRRRIKAIGDGKALVFQDGKKIEARWIKKTQDARLMFLDYDGNDIELVRGTTWVEVVGDLDDARER